MSLDVGQRHCDKKAIANKCKDENMATVSSPILLIMKERDIEASRVYIDLSYSCNEILDIACSA